MSEVYEGFLGYTTSMKDEGHHEEPDMVNHPPHYQSKAGIEVADVIEAFTEDLKGYEAAWTSNVIKYVLRWKHKNGDEDLKKAIWYINRILKNHEKEKSNEGKKY